jgi:hypothetical protein
MCDSDGFAEGSLNFDLASADGREKHATKPVQFGKPVACSRSFDESFRLVYCIKRFGDAIREV